VTWALLLLISVALTRLLLRRPRPVEGAAYLLLFVLVPVPLVVANLLFLGERFASLQLLQGCALGLAGVIGAVWATRRWLTGAPGPRIVEGTPPLPVVEWIVLIVAACVGAGAWAYYSDAEFLLSIGSYLQRGEAECFYMQTFSFIEGLNPDQAKPTVDKAYAIITTPGNALFTASLMPLLGAETFHVLYTAFLVLLFLFVFLLVQEWTGSKLAALGAGLFAVCNPYMLSLEVLDRNLIALALSAAAFHALLTHGSRPLLVGLLLGLMAGSGLRFLPLTLLLPAGILLLKARKPRSWWALATLSFLVAFSFNLPHLAHHGFHSLGETESLWALAALVVTDFSRTPLLPYPNLLYYPIHALSYTGAAALGLVVLGAARMASRDRRLACAMGLVFALPYLVLACQRDWIQGDKSRILLMAFLPIVVWFGGGIAALLTPERRRSSIAVAALAAATGLALGSLAPRLETTADPESQERHPVYQGETDAWASHYRDQFTRIGLLPNFERLFQKTDLARKERADALIAQTLFGATAAASTSTNPWVRQHMSAESLDPVPTRPLKDDYALVEINLDKLGTAVPGAVTLVQEAPPQQPQILPLVDLRTESDMLQRRRAFGVDVAAYHKEVQVSWQEEVLKVTVLADQPEVGALGELAIDLNAWTTVGRDEFEFQRLQVLRSAQAQRPSAASMTALPQRDIEPTVLLRVPTDLDLLVRSWVVDGQKGVPHRVDAWRIRILGNDKPEVSFYCLEPESYL